MVATEDTAVDTMARGPLRLPLLLPLRLMLLPRPITDTEDTGTVDMGTDTAMVATEDTAVDTMARGPLRLLLLLPLRLLLLPRPITDTEDTGTVDTDTDMAMVATVDTAVDTMARGPLMLLPRHTMDTDMEVTAMATVMDTDKKELDDVKISVGQIMKWFLILVMITPCNLLN